MKQIIGVTIRGRVLLVLVDVFDTVFKTLYLNQRLCYTFLKCKYLKGIKWNYMGFSKQGLMIMFYLLHKGLTSLY